jgi:hypothetical protein
LRRVSRSLVQDHSLASGMLTAGAP